MYEQLKQAALASEAPPEYRSEFHKMLYDFHDIFRCSGDKTHTCPLFEQAIPLTDDMPVCKKQYPLPYAARDALSERVTEFLDAGIIQPSNSSYNSPVCMVKKKDGSWRLCVDFRELNEKILADPFPLPRIDEMLEQFRGCEYLSTGDLFWGFYHVKVKPQDTYKLAFTTDQGRFEFIHLPMGLKTSPAVFQRLMNMAFQDYLKLFTLIYMDDVIIFSKSAEQHMKDLRKVFERMKSAGLRFKIEKCKFFRKELKFLGFVVSKQGIRLDPSKVDIVTQFPKPDKDVGQLQSFLGIVGYFKKHIPNYAILAKPLYDMLKGEAAHTKKQKGRIKTKYKVNE
jgi:hypothetical protein